MSYTIRIIRKGKTPQQLVLDAIKKIDGLKAKIKELGATTRDKMKETITINKKRPGGGELEKSITVDYMVDGVSWGVGNISKLNSEVPYWKAVNWGSSHIVGKKVPAGEFAPGEARPSKPSFRAGRWIKGTGKYSFVSKNPIPPMNYVEKTVFWFKSVLGLLKVK